MQICRGLYAKTLEGWRGILQTKEHVAKFVCARVACKFCLARVLVSNAICQ